MSAALCEYLAARGYAQLVQQPERRADHEDDTSPNVSHNAEQNHTLETIEAYIVASSAVPPTLPIVLDALRRYLKTMGVSMPTGPLRIPQLRTIEDESGHSFTNVQRWYLVS